MSSFLFFIRWEKFSKAFLGFLFLRCYFLNIAAIFIFLVLSLSSFSPSLSIFSPSLFFLVLLSLSLFSPSLSSFSPSLFFLVLLSLSLFSPSSLFFLVLLSLFFFSPSHSLFSSSLYIFFKVVVCTHCVVDKKVRSIMQMILNSFVGCERKSYLLSQMYILHSWLISK